jgi:hypothetical protein
LLRSGSSPWHIFFTQNGMSNPEIAKHVKVIIQSLTEIGLEVDATM